MHQTSTLYLKQSHMRNILDLKTCIQVPLHLMYLDLGQVPARYQVKGFKVNFLQDDCSLLHRMLMAQQHEPVSGDWFSVIIRDLDIGLRIEEIRTMKRTIFRKISNLKCEEAAFTALIQKRDNGKKGKNIKYGSSLEMADYLCPNSQLTVQDQKDIFQIRSMTNTLPSNRGDPKPCSTGCGDFMENPHIYLCPVLNEEPQGDINRLLNGTLNEMKLALQQWRENMKKVDYFYSMDSI